MINRILKFFSTRTNKKDIRLMSCILNDYILALKDDAIYDFKKPSHQYKELGICWYASQKYNVKIIYAIQKWNDDNNIHYYIGNTTTGYWCKPGNIVDRIPIIERLLKDLIKDKHFKIIS